MDRPRRARLRGRPSAPDYVPPEGATAPDAIGGDRPVHHADRRQGAGCTRPTGLADGPMPTHYEPQESPVRQRALRRSRPTRPGRSSRATTVPTRPTRSGSDVFPYVFTTYRLTEHHTAGGMSRDAAVPAELQPELFCEVSPELAARARAGATAAGPRSSPRGRRSRRGCWSPSGCGRCSVGGRVIHQIGAALPLGAQRAVAPATPPTTCFGVVLDPNVHIQETKAATCDIRPGRRPRGPGLLPFVADYRDRAGPSPATGATSMTQPAVRPAGRPAAPTRATPTTTRRGWGSSPTPASASAARPARWPARSGTRSPTTAIGPARACPTTTPAARRQHLAARRVHRADRPPGRRTARAVDLGCRRRATGGCRRGRDGRPLADVVGRLQALHARRAASTSARPARCSAPSSARSSCRRTSATAAATASRPARTA